MRLWHVTLCVLLACGGKIATQFDDVPGAPKPGPSHVYGDDDDDYGDDDDDDDRPPKKKQPPTTFPGSSTSGYDPGTSSGTSGSTSSSGSVPGCGPSVSYGCGANPSDWKCALQGTPTLSCYGKNDSSYAYCSCSGIGSLDAGYGFDAGYYGTDQFTVPIGQGGAPDVKMLYSIWNTYCGGYCY